MEERTSVPPFKGLRATVGMRGGEGRIRSLKSEESYNRVEERDKWTGYPKNTVSSGLSKDHPGHFSGLNSQP